jgi:crossover junction endodeoxyribonuclease RuvC
VLLFTRIVFTCLGEFIFMRILGIDPGTARMGVGVIDFTTKKGPEFICAEVLVTSNDLLPENRLKFLYKELTELFKKYDPDAVVIEKLFFNTNVKTAMTVGQARGIAMLVTAMNKLKVYEYTALEAKLSLTGYGRSDKKVVQQSVMEILGLDKVIKSDDANDAVAMALCHAVKAHSFVSKVAAAYVKA